MTVTSRLHDRFSHLFHFHAHGPVLASLGGDLIRLGGGGGDEDDQLVADERAEAS